MTTTTESFKVTKTFDIRVKQLQSGWWEAWSGKLGSTIASTKEECMRIMKQRAEQD